MYTYMKRFLFTLVFFFLSGINSLGAAQGNWLSSDYAKIRLISGTEAVGNLKEIPAALEFQLEPGWKVYWRSPGDAGLPPELSPDVEAQKITRFWPVPERLSIFGIDSFGYSGRVILPLFIAHNNQGKDFSFRGQLDALICSDICVPIAGSMSLFLPEGRATASVFAQEIAYAKAQVPTNMTGPDIALGAINLLLETRTVQIVLSVPDGRLDDIFIETKLPGYSFSKPKVKEKSDARVVVDVTVNGNQPVAALNNQNLILTILSGEQKKEIEAVISTGNSQNFANNSSSLSGYIVILLTSFIGGFILNFMPCVLPVLTLKVSSFLNATNKSHSHMRRHFLATALGIISSFILLSLGLLIFRSIGYQIGWGVQFQSPIFLAFIAIILIIFIASLLDWVYLPIPKFAAKLSAPAAYNTGYRYDFLSGMLATILATPCSAPFVGTAAAFALSGSNLILISVLLVMGLGLASPFIIFAAVPSLTSFLPNPGRWMLRIKQISAFLLCATLIWILWIFSNVIGWRQDTLANAKMNYQPWSNAVMEEAISTRRPVFVDVTADWCITCNVNKLAVLETKPIIQAFEDANFILLQADWTSPNDEIAAFLAKHGKFGIPFDIIFSPQLDSPIILPEILTTDRMLSSIMAAKVDKN